MCDVHIAPMGSIPVRCDAMNRNRLNVGLWVLHTISAGGSGGLLNWSKQGVLRGWTGAMCLVLVLSGCAVQNVGFLAAEVTKAKGSTVVDVYSVGVHLRTRNDDPGLTIGAARRSYVFADTEAIEFRPGWHYFVAPLSNVQAVALDTRAVGIEIRAGAPDLSLTVGLSADTILAQVPRDSSVISRLSYAPNSPSSTNLEYCDEDGRCW